jgi:hypothetical protein
MIKCKKYQWGVVAKNRTFGDEMGKKKELIKLLPAFTGVAGTAGLTGLANGSNVQQQVRKYGGIIRTKYHNNNKIRTIYE